MTSAYPEFQNSMKGIMTKVNPKPEFSVKCSSDQSYCVKAFSDTIGTGNYWGISERNGYGEIRFKNKYIILSHYSLESFYPNAPKTIIAKGIKKNGVFVDIDYISESINLNLNLMLKREKLITQDHLLV